MILKSPAWKDGGTIPARFTCEGDDVNPLFEIRETPREAKSLALIVDDPDATSGDIWDHWVVWNINPKTQYIAEDSVPPGAVEGRTSFGENKYGGPCPPIGKAPHHYRFKLFALDTELQLPETAGRKEVEAAAEGHILERAEITGTFGRE
jgi:Raf kinase inhibitor-like YbhB/YbcL family protein